MSTQTDNYGFVKPARTEKYMVAVFNANMDTIDTILKQIADSSGGDVPDNVVTTDDVATITQAGIIKLYNSGGTNRSGLLVQADGALLVNANAAYGTQRTVDGKLTTAGATEEEIDAGTNEYKPITPATIKYAVEKYAPGGGGITGPIGTDDIADGAVITDKIADGAVTAEKLSEEYAKSAGSGSTIQNVDLDTLTQNGIYSVYCDHEKSEEYHFPQLTVSGGIEIGAHEGSIIVTENLDGCSQLYINYGVDSIGDDTAKPTIAYRTLNNNSGTWIVDSDWKFTDDIADGSVTTAKVADKAITAAKIADGVIPSAVLITYSTTPQRIGTWIDGTPVWRLAFDAKVAPGTPDTVQITFAADGDNVRVLNCKAWLTMDYNHIDTTELQPYGEGSYYSTNTANGKLEIYKSGNGPENHAYGYIEYVTPESNLPQT